MNARRGRRGRWTLVGAIVLAPLAVATAAAWWVGLFCSAKRENTNALVDAINDAIACEDEYVVVPASGGDRWALLHAYASEQWLAAHTDLALLSRVGLAMRDEPNAVRMRGRCAKGLTYIPYGWEFDPMVVREGDVLRITRIPIHHARTQDRCRIECVGRLDAAGGDARHEQPRTGGTAVPPAAPGN